MQTADLRRYARSIVRAIKTLLSWLYVAAFVAFLGWVVVAGVLDIARDGPSWRAFKATVGRAIEWVEGGPPSFQECQDAANVWRKYGRAKIALL